MDKNKLNKELEELCSNPQRYAPISVKFTYNDNDAFRYRLAHLMFKYSDVEMTKDEINKTIFCVGLEILDERARKQIEKNNEYSTN